MLTPVRSAAGWEEIRQSYKGKYEGIHGDPKSRNQTQHRSIQVTGPK